MRNAKGQSQKRAKQKRIKKMKERHKEISRLSDKAERGGQSVQDEDDPEWWGRQSKKAGRKRRPQK